MHSPGPSPSDIQFHLYSSFLQASTWDVALRVSGTWCAIYKLHRVVLIQSGFFRSLFTAGFSESSLRFNHLRDGTDEINVIFDDYNITRAAFETCISRLYGGGPPLYVSPNLIPTTSQPLTSMFSGVANPGGLPSGHHPATPHFLASLLATAIYLSIPSVASQALSLILKTIGPSTVLPYLNFALGKPIGRAVDDFQAAVGLEHIAVLLKEGDGATGSSTRAQNTKLTEEDTSENASTSSLLSFDSDLDDGPEYRPSYHYGAVSDKVGEACVCWLARWSTDILHYEDVVQSEDGSEHHRRSRSLSSVLEPQPTNSRRPATQLASTIFGRGGLTMEWIAALVSADTLFVRNERERYNLAASIAELRRRDNILEEEEKVWATIFEYAIYYANMTFEDILFISQDISPTTKRRFTPLSVLQASHWAQSILRHHVTHRGSVSPNSPSIPSSPPLPPRDKELGIAQTTADILAGMADSTKSDAASLEKSKLYFPVLGDTSIRIGDGGSLSSATPTGTSLSMEQLFASSHSSDARTTRPAGQNGGKGKVESTMSSNISTNEAGFFGLLTERYHEPACIKSDPTGKRRWSPFPPFRFAVEFWDVDLLKEKSRLHSHTIWYAGNLFNVYVQIVRKKGQAQLGVYLHRQSHVDPIPAASTPGMTVSAQSTKSHALSPPYDRQLHAQQPSLPVSRSLPSPQNVNHYSPSIHPPVRSTTPSTTALHASPPSPSASLPSTSFVPESVPFTSNPLAPIQPYRDPRSSITAYFAISCASATGSSQTRFSSAPDIFSVSQSWGWKSSTLRTDEFVDVGTQPLPSDIFRGKEVSLRATIVLGVV